MLGLAVPPERLMQAVEQPRAVLQGIVHGDQAGAAAHAALGCRLQAVQTDEGGRQRQPAAVGVELLLQVGDGATHAVRDRLAGVAYVVQARAITLLRHDLAQQIGEDPADRLALLAPVPFDRDPVEDGETGAVDELCAHLRHHTGACRQVEMVRPERPKRADMPAHGMGDLFELCGACRRGGHEPGAAPQL
jgi:hypothetical protein